MGLKLTKIETNVEKLWVQGKMFESLKSDVNILIYGNIPSYCVLKIVTNTFFMMNISMFVNCPV